MVKKEGTKLNLLSYMQYYKVVDTDPTSRFYLRFLDFPKTLYAGKNIIKINANSDTLYNGSSIYIEFVDSGGNILYHEILNYLDKEKYRSIAVYVTENTPPGNFTAYFACTAKYDLQSKLLPFQNQSNYLWIGVGSISTNTNNNSEIVNIKHPIIDMKEVIVPHLDSSRSRFKTVYSNNSRAIAMGNNLPQQYSGVDYKFDSEKTFDIQPVIYNNNSGSRSATTLYVPESDNSYGYIETVGFLFNSNMLNGNLVFNNINLSQYKPNNVSSSYFANVGQYTCSIVDVVNSNLVKVYPPFRKNISYFTYDKQPGKISITNAILASNEITSSGPIIDSGQIFGGGGSSNSVSEFTCSYFTQYPVTSSMKKQSMVLFDIKNITPDIGNIDYVNVQYKSVGEIGTYRDFGKADLEAKNLLFTSRSFYNNKETGYSFLEYGNFKNYTTYITYWNTFDNINKLSYVSESQSNYPLLDSIKFSSTVHTGSGEYYGMQLSSWRPLIGNSDYILQFNAACDTTTNVDNSKMDVYISGSNIETNIVSSNLNLISPNVSGVYIGSLKANAGKIFKDIKLDFKASQNTLVYIKFILTGRWSISDIKLYSKAGPGQTPNHTYVLLPLDNVIKRNIEYEFKLSYGNANGKTSNVENTLYGIRFNGGNTWIEGLDNIVSGSIYASNAFDARLDDTASIYYGPGAPLNSRTALASVYVDSSILNGVASFEVLDASSYSSASIDPSRPDSTKRIFYVSGSNVFINRMEATLGGTAVKIDNEGKLVSTVSDEKLKSNIKEMDSSTIKNKINELRPVTFTFKDGTSRHYGLIAQEVERVFPEFVSQYEQYKTVDYEMFTSVLIKSVQDLYLEIESLKEIINKNDNNNTNKK